MSQSSEGQITTSTNTSTQLSTPILPSYRILLLVRTGRDYKLSQIDVSVLSCNQFFSRLRTSYLGLRGFLRTYFSVWRYSHCDFYMVTPSISTLPS